MTTFQNPLIEKGSLKQSTSGFSQDTPSLHNKNTALPSPNRDRDRVRKQDRERVVKRWGLLNRNNLQGQALRLPKNRNRMSGRDSITPTIMSTIRKVSPVLPIGHRPLRGAHQVPAALPWQRQSHLPPAYKTQARPWT